MNVIHKRPKSGTWTRITDRPMSLSEGNVSVTTKGRKRKGEEANMVEVNEGDQGKIIKMEDYERPQNLGALKKKICGRFEGHLSFQVSGVDKNEKKFHCH